MSSIPNLPQDEEPYFLPDPLPIAEPGPLLGATRASVDRARKRDLTALWAVLGLGGITLAGYAVKLALEPAPVVAVAVPSPAPAVSAAPVPDPAPAPRARRPRPVAVSRKAAEAPVERVVEPQVASKAEAPPMDSDRAFESGSQFDNTQQADRRGRPRRSFENPSHGYISRMAPRPDRPNAPDPSFAAEDAAQPAAKGRRP